MKIFYPKKFTLGFLITCLLMGSVTLLFSQETSKPNIVIILTDDQGYADISFNPEHPSEVSTPHMDALANEGLFFSQAYISGNVCSPTRAGLMTGRYQQRAGVYTAGEGGTGMDLSIPIFPSFLESKGYVSGAFGKWHLGLSAAHNPIPRGFDEFFGFMGRGAHDYYTLDNLDDPLYLGTNPVVAEGYLTNLLTDSAVSFIRNHKDEPFFCYLAYNAVHSPMQAPAEDIADFNTGDPTRDILMAMLRHLDNGVGEVVNTLKDEGVWDNTLLFFLTDNGGAGATHADNSPLRGLKNQNWEGGIRTPFILSWPSVYEGNRIIHTPIISLDLLPTVLDALDIDEPTDLPFDGKSILPIIENEDTAHHEFMFWTEGGARGEWAVRYKDWKLVVEKEDIHLSDLATDTAEATNLINVYPDTADHMIAAFLDWLEEMAEPIQEPSKAWIPKIDPGQLASLYDRLYFRGNVQHFPNAGTYNAGDLSGIGDNKTQSILITGGYEIKAYSEDELGGAEFITTKAAPFVNKLDDGLSSFILSPIGGTSGQDVEEVSITASTAANSVSSVRDDDYGTYWESIGQSEWISFEFCQKVKTNGIHIAFKRGDLRIGYFDVETSEDGQTWNTVIAGAQSSGSSRNLEFFPFPEVTAKFVRIVGKGNSDNNQNHYTEVRMSVLDLAMDGIVIKAEDYTGSSKMDVIGIDDCVGFTGITNNASDAYAVYEINDVAEGSYQIQIRAKPKKNGILDIYVNELLQSSIEISSEMAGNTWVDLKNYMMVPPGDKSLKIAFRGEGGNGIELNWHQLSPGTHQLETELSSLQIFPNPCSGNLTINAEVPILEIEVFDQSGRKVLQHFNQEKQVILAVSSLQNGMYISKIRTRDNTAYLRFIKAS